MKANVDRSGCIGCGLCENICHDVFQIDDKNIAKVICDEIPESANNSVVEAKDSCPVSVISIDC